MSEEELVITNEVEEEPIQVTEEKTKQTICICRSCGSSETPHNYRHPFDPMYITGVNGEYTVNGDDFPIKEKMGYKCGICGCPEVVHCDKEAYTHPYTKVGTTYREISLNLSGDKAVCYDCKQVHVLRSKHPFIVDLIVRNAKETDVIKVTVDGRVVPHKGFREFVPSRIPLGGFP